MKRSLAVIFSLSLLALALFLKVSGNPVLVYFQLKVFDQFQIHQPRAYEDAPVAIVDIDDESLSRLGQWPWPRRTLADITERLTKAGAAAIAFDVVFPEADRTSPHLLVPIWKKEPGFQITIKDLPNYDQQFADAIKGSPVITGFVLTNNAALPPKAKAGMAFAGEDPKPFIPAFTGSISSLLPLTEAAAGNGALNSDPDPDGILRKVPLLFRVGNQMYPSLAAEALRVAQGASTIVVRSVGASGESGVEGTAGITAVKIGQFEIPTDAHGRVWVYYTEDVPSRYIPAWKLLEPDFDNAAIAGKIIFIGTSAAGLKDIRSSPLNPVISGVEVHAQALEQILVSRFLTRPDWMQGAEISLMIFVGLLVMAIMWRLTPLWGAAFTLCVIAAGIGFSWNLFLKHGLLIDPVTPGITILLVYLSESLFRFIGSEQERHRVRHAFSHYMSPTFVEQLARHPEKLVLGGESRELSVMFSDIRGFTTIAEPLSAQELTRFINSFLTPMTDVIMRNQGTIDKYMGDAIMAFWNAPLDDADHARHACISALEMHTALLKLNAERKTECEKSNTPYLPIAIGVGVNTGEASVGNLGSTQRFDYSVMGDNVNLASRLEGQCKTYGTATILGSKTQAQVPDFATIEIDLIRVKGKKSAVRIYALLGDATLAQTPAFLALKQNMDLAIAAYRAQEWADALSYLKKAEAIYETMNIDLSTLIDLYRDRIRDCAATPPPDGWDGVYESQSK